MVEAIQNACTMCHKGMPPEMASPRAITGCLCMECLSRFGAGAGMPLMDFLDKLSVPVLASDGDAVVSQTNKPMLALLGKKLSQVKGQRGGNVFECKYARLPGGCGHTVHCSGCAIRRAVVETFTTGKSLHNVPAYLDRDMVTQALQLGLVISTEKVWNMVLLRIDYIGPNQDPGRKSYSQ